MIEWTTQQQFQFHNGSIKSHFDGIGNTEYENVSIPQWFD